MSMRFALATTAITLALSSVHTPAAAVTLYATPGNMADLDIGSDGDVFAIARPASPGANGTIYTWVRGGWQPFSGGGLATRVAVDPDGNPWVITNSHQVWRHTGSGWLLLSGSMRELDIGADGSVFALGEPTASNGYVYRWNGSSWTYFGGYGTSITVDQNGRPWITNSLGEVWRNTTGSWTRVTGIVARDIDAGANGTIYALAGGVSGDKTIYRWTGSGWAHNGDSGVRIAVSPTGAPNVVRADGSVRSNFVRRLHGTTSCPSSATDCNPCAVDVRRQLRDAFAGKMHWQPQHWRLNWDGTFPPHDLDPNIPFEDGQWPISSKHVQGFVRTRSASVPYVGSFSDDTHGSVFMIGSRNLSPFFELNSIHLMSEAEQHPSGVHTLGDWVAVADDGRLRFLHTELWDLDHTIYHDVPELFSAGGGLGLARLTGGGYVLISTLPGSIDDRPRINRVWKLDGSIFFGLTATQLTETPYWPNPEWTGNYQFSENLSVITECDTGHLYTIHSTGPNEIWGTGYFRLSRLEESPTTGASAPNGLVLRGLDVYQKSQDMSNCYLRATGTAFTNEQGIIDLYCHSYDPRNEWLETEENVPFYRGIGYYSSCFNRCGGSTPSGCFCDPQCASFGDCCTDKVAICGL